MSDDILKKFAARYAAQRIDLSQLCFKEQLAFVTDPAPYVTAVCSRRAGKSTGCAADLLHTAQANPGTVSLYVTLSSIIARRVFWPIVKGMATNYKLGAAINETQLSLTFSNGSVIYCLGARDENSLNNFIGLPLKRVYIDEAQNFRSYLSDLIERALEPALLDYNGDLRLIGTPGAVKAGSFWDICKSDKWSHHKWTYFQNPWIPIKSKKTHEEGLQRVLLRRGVDRFNPAIRREYFGEWEQDTDSLVLQYSAQVNDYKDLPKEKMNYVLGIDLGFNDADALAVLAWSPKSPVTYLVEERLTRKQDITSLVQQIDQLRTRYDIAKMVIDTGGLGKKISEELLRRWKIPVEAADKTRKFENLAILNDALRTGRLRAKNVSAFADDCNKVEWDHDKSTPEKLVISDRYHSDIIDAVLYAFKLSPAFAWDPPTELPRQGSPEWIRAQEEDMFNQALERAQQEKATTEQELSDLYGSKKW